MVPRRETARLTLSALSNRGASVLRRSRLIVLIAPVNKLLDRPSAAASMLTAKRRRHQPDFNPVADCVLVAAQNQMRLTHCNPRWPEVEYLGDGLDVHCAHLSRPSLAIISLTEESSIKSTASSLIIRPTNSLFLAFCCAGITSNPFLVRCLRTARAA